MTGGNGFIGSHLVEHLVKRGVSVRCLVRKTGNLSWLEGLELEYVVGDATDYDSLEPAVSGVDTVFHLAGRTKSSTKDGYYQANVIGTVNILKAVVKTNPNLNRFLYVSSQGAAGPSLDSSPVTESDSPNPVTSYGASKLAGEEAVRKFSSQIPVTIVRPPVVYGPRDTAIYEFFRMVCKGIKPILGWRDRYGSFIYVEDLIQGLLLAAEMREAVGQVYFLVSESQVSWKELNNEIARALGKRALILHVPISLTVFAALVREIVSKMMKKPSIVDRQKIRELRERFWICDGTKAREELGFRPKYSFKQGMEKSAAWYRKVGWI